VGAILPISGGETGGAHTPIPTDDQIDAPVEVIGGDLEE
jgi:hypothetical protein